MPARRPATPLPEPPTGEQAPARTPHPRSRTDRRPRAGTGASPAGGAGAPRIDQIIEALILALLLYLPLAFGGVMAQSRIVLIALGSLIAACFAVRCIAEPKATITASWAFVPLVGLVLVALLQLVPLPIGLVDTLSPNAAEIWRTAAAAAGTEATTATFSVYPHGTRADIVLLACAIIVLMVGATIYRRRGAFRRLLTGIALIGLLVALIGLTQTAFGATQIYWTFDGPSVPKAGPFASYSHYSEFINIAIGCAVGVLLMRAAARAPGRQIELGAIIDWRGSSLVERALSVLLMVGAIAIVLSTSRNGLISLVVASAVTAALMQTSRKIEGIGWPLVGFGFVAFIMLLALGIDPVIDRFQGTFEAPVDSMSTRFELIRDTTSMAFAFGPFGAGLGAYELAFPGFDTAVRSGTAQHAENQYMEVFAELGFIGALLALAFGIMAVVIIWRRIRTTASRTDMALFGAVFAIVAIAFHSLTDFGLEIPAIAIAIAAVLGAALGRSATVILDTVKARAVTAVLAAGAAILLVTSLPASFAAHEGERHAFLASELRNELSRTQGIGSAEQHARLIEHTSSAATEDPANVDHRFWAAFARWNGAVADAMDHDGEAPAVNQRSHPELIPQAQIAVDAFVAALQVGPTHGQSWSVAGQLRRLWLESDQLEAPTTSSPSAGLTKSDQEAGDWILRGRALAPHHPSTCLAAAFELMRRGEERASLDEMDRAVHIGASTYGVVDLLAVDLGRPNLAHSFVEGDLGLTKRLIAHVKDEEAHAALASHLNDEYEALLETACATPGARPHELADLARLEQKRGNLDESAALYRRLLGIDPYSKQRYNYAKLLVAMGDERNARRALRDVIQFHPDHGAAANLLQKLEQTDKR